MAQAAKLLVSSAPSPWRFAQGAAGRERLTFEMKCTVLSRDREMCGVRGAPLLHLHAPAPAITTTATPGPRPRTGPFVDWPRGGGRPPLPPRDIQKAGGVRSLTVRSSPSTPPSTDRPSPCPCPCSRPIHVHVSIHATTRRSPSQENLVLCSRAPSVCPSPRKNSYGKRAINHRRRAQPAGAQSARARCRLGHFALPSRLDSADLVKSSYLQGEVLQWLLGWSGCNGSARSALSEIPSQVHAGQREGLEKGGHSR